MLELRHYQRAALDSLYAYWAEGGGNGLIVLPTGAGKALVIAKLIEELLKDYPDMRIANVTHSASLVEQNFKEFIGLSPFAPAGIYSASLGRRDTRSQVLFCGIQSVYKRTEEIGPLDLIIVDEAHAISRNANTQYGKFFDGVKKVNPDSRVCGTTATDFRMDSGRLTDDLDDDEELVAANDDGEQVLVRPARKKLFDDVVYEIGLTELIEEGYLTRLTSRKTTSKINLKGVGTRGGDYIPGQLSKAAEEIIEAAVAEDMAISEGRRAGLFFSTSKENARHIAECVRRHGRPCAVLTSDNAHETKKIFEDFRAGRIWAISSVSMITTGTNFPFVDFISLILSTKSPGKLIQILGRGTRNSPGKVDCLVADHGRNLAFHGPIDQIKPKPPGSGEGEQPQKTCPTEDGESGQKDIEGKWGCGESIPISRMVCHCCCYIFPPSEEVKITAEAADAPVLSTAEPEPRTVTKRVFRHHPGKANKPDSVKCTYSVGLTHINEWICPEHSGFPGAKAQRYWREHKGKLPYPKTVLDFLERQSELCPTESVMVKPEGKWWTVTSHKPAEFWVSAPEPRKKMSAMMADDIPF